MAPNKTISGMRRHLLERKYNLTTLTPARDIVTGCNRRYTQHIQPEKRQTGIDNPPGSDRHTSLPCTCTYPTSETNSTIHNRHFNNYQHVFQPTVPSGPCAPGRLHHKSPPNSCSTSPTRPARHPPIRRQFPQSQGRRSYSDASQ
jgi:hypothetical protein